MRQLTSAITIKRHTHTVLTTRRDDTHFHGFLFQLHIFLFLFLNSFFFLFLILLKACSIIYYLISLLYTHHTINAAFTWALSCSSYRTFTWHYSNLMGRFFICSNRFNILMNNRMQPHKIWEVYMTWLIHTVDASRINVRMYIILLPLLCLLSI